MPLHFIRETLEQETITLDATGEAFVQKRINLRSGFAHNLLQTDLFCDSFVGVPGQCLAEIIISPYPVIPTTMDLSAQYVGVGRYPAAGNDLVLFKANCTLIDQQTPVFDQFPSLQIAAQQKDTFYSDHVYINLHIVGDADAVLSGLALSFLMVVDNKKASVLTSSMGQMAENHDAMCAELMNNGHMTTRAILKGNIFPMWRYGGVRPELMISGSSLANFFNRTSAQEESNTLSTVDLRGLAKVARQMQPNLDAFGTADIPVIGSIPDWVRFELWEGVESGPVRDQWPPIKHADNGNVLTL